MALLNSQVNNERLLLFNQRNSSVINDIQEAQLAAEECQRKYNTFMSKYNETKRKCDKFFDLAKELIGDQLPHTRNFPHREAFAEEPDSPEDLENKINDLNGVIQCLCYVDNNVIDEIKNLELSIGRYKASLEELQNSQQEVSQSIRASHTDWYNTVSECIAQINNKFGEYMTELKFAGEVVIVYKSEFQYDTYGLQIRVKYRENEKLEMLDSYRQSGGERTLAIAIFLLSMQEQCRVPFRFADELNQGVDPTNERKLFELFVTQISKAGPSQYFFITPKLLPGLSHNNHMKVHVIFNSPLLQDNVFRSV